MVCDSVFVVDVLITVARGILERTEITRLRVTEVCFLGLRLGVSATSSSSLDTMVFDCILAGEGVAYKCTQNMAHITVSTIMKEKSGTQNEN